LGFWWFGNIKWQATKISLQAQKMKPEISTCVDKQACKKLEFKPVLQCMMCPPKKEIFERNFLAGFRKFPMRGIYPSGKFAYHFYAYTGPVDKKPRLVRNKTLQFKSFKKHEENGAPIQSFPHC
jgi:hypothetical protein